MEFELLFSGQDLESAKGSTDRTRDLQLDILLQTMSGGNRAVEEVCAKVMARLMTDSEAIHARSMVVRDAVACRDAFREVFAVSNEAVETVHTQQKFVNPKYDHILSNEKKISAEVEIAKINLRSLRRLHAVLGAHRSKFASNALQDLCHCVKDLLDGNEFSSVEARLHQLKLLRSAYDLSICGRIGEGLKLADILVDGMDEPSARRKQKPAADETVIPLSGAALVQNAEEITESALTPIHRVIADFNRSILLFFEKLLFQSSFFLGCANLHQRLAALNVSLCFPILQPADGEYAATGLNDASLALKEGCAPTANAFCFSGKRQILITGPNQGGKTTFLRSVGLAQVMAQCGMFVAAQSYVCPVFKGVFTHFPGAEDTQLKMGLLETELRKMSDIIDGLKPGSLLMMNESFQSTMPLDAKCLAEQIISALADAGTTVLFVTHLYAFAMERYRQHPADTLFLKAERGADDRNTYVIREDAPFKSAFGMELFSDIIHE